MQMNGNTDGKNDHVPNAGKILLVGDLANAFPDADLLMPVA